MKVRIGYEGREPRQANSFSIDQIEYTFNPPTLTVSATSADFTGSARAPREASYSVIAFSDLVEQLAARHGYSAKVEPASLAQVTLTHVDQAGQSDLALISELAEEHGAVFKPVDGVWWVRSYDAVSADPVLTLRPEDVSGGRAHFQARSRNGTVVAHYQDFDQAKRVPVEAGSGEPRKVLDRTFPDEATARANAEAELGRSRRRARKLTLDMPGRPDIASQTVIALEGFRDQVDDNWLVTSVSHVITKKRGYTCRVECEGI
ncbi:MAG: phage late control D family protein [Thiohalospira sp.]